MVTYYRTCVKHQNRKGNKVNTWTTYGVGKKLVGQVKSGYKFTATGQAQYKGRTWYRIKDNKWIPGTNTVTTKKYASIKAAEDKKTKQNKVVKLANAEVGKAYVWGQLVLTVLIAQV